MTTQNNRFKRAVRLASIAWQCNDYDRGNLRFCDIVAHYLTTKRTRVKRTAIMAASSADPIQARELPKLTPSTFASPFAGIYTKNAFYIGKSGLNKGFRRKPQYGKAFNQAILPQFDRYQNTRRYAN